jgi:hypothetical protein
VAGIDLRREFASMMENHGWWAVLRRRLSLKKQEPFNTTTDEGTFRRTNALGSGENYVDHFVRVRNMSLFESPEQASSLGREASPLVRFYLQHHTKPDVHDFIAELAQDESTASTTAQLQPLRPYKIAKLWDIQEVRAMRDQGGRCEFWQVLVKEATVGDLS